MDLRKYSVSEFSEMLENEMKLNKEKCEKIAKYYEMKRDIKNDLEITYKIVAPVEKNVYYRRPLEMAYNYESTLWGMKEAQISSFTGVKNKEYFVNTINYCRAKYIKEAIEEIIKIKSIPEENEFSIYSEQEFVLDSWMDYPKVYLLEEWPEEDCHWKKEFLDKTSVVFDDTREDNLKEKLALERKEKAENAKKVGQLLGE